MNLSLFKGKIQKQNISIPGSKSETNRLLLLQAFFPNISFQNASDSVDSEVMQSALMSNDTIKDVHHAGTAMRFLTAFYASKPHVSVVLKGSERMHQRPIAILVDALKSLGAEIDYLEKTGFPPLKINGKTLSGGKIQLNAQVSSQYISALLMMGSQMKDGLQIQLLGKVTSKPYILMTLELMSKLGIENSWKEDIIHVKPSFLDNQTIEFVIESDWSSASYFYTLVAFSDIGYSLKLSSFKYESLQADRVVVDLFEKLGVQTTFVGNDIILLKSQKHLINTFSYDFQHCPDIAQTLAVACLGLGVDGDFFGLHTLKIKETDRIVALQNEMTKLGADVSSTEDSLSFKSPLRLHKNINIATYNDHRMAMAFAPLALKIPIQIEDANVVEKSYPLFWSHLEALGFSFEEI